MNLPIVPIAHGGFYATHFFTMRDQEKSKDFYVRILGGKVIKAENPCYIKLANTWIILNSGVGPPSINPRSFSNHHPTLTGQVAFSISGSPTSGPATNNGTRKARSFLPSHLTTVVGNGVATCATRTDTSSKSANILRLRSIVSNRKPVKKTADATARALCEDISFCADPPQSRDSNEMRRQRRLRDLDPNGPTPVKSSATVVESKQQGA